HKFLVRHIFKSFHHCLHWHLRLRELVRAYEPPFAITFSSSPRWPAVIACSSPLQVVPRINKKWQCHPHHILLCTLGDKACIIPATSLLAFFRSCGVSSPLPLILRSSASSTACCRYRRRW